VWLGLCVGFCGGLAVGWGSTKIQFRNVNSFVSVVVLLLCGWGFASGFAVVLAVGWGSTEIQFLNAKHFVSVVVLLLCGWGFASGFAMFCVGFCDVLRCFASGFAISECKTFCQRCCVVGVL